MHKSGGLEDVHTLSRRTMLLASGLWLGGVGLPVAARPKATAERASAWPDWDGFAQQFLQADGRILANDDQQTHSEAQSYALMFALIANDRTRFERILRWTEDNLCAGDITARLPGWLWGRSAEGRWGVLDSNAASDADLWIAYALLEAGRLWQVRRYRALGGVLAARILAEETVSLPSLGRTLLPGPQGFTLEAGQRWRLNPSYLPIQQFRLLAHATQDDAWQEVCTSSQRVVIESAPRGFAPDWVQYVVGKGFVPDHEGDQQARGGYNAIRVYLWAGMLDANDAARAPLLQALAPMVQRVAELGYPPEYVDSVTGVVYGAAGGGFSAALLPLLKVSDQPNALLAQQKYLQSHPPGADAYYGQCLRLWGQGWMEGAYRFARNGQLIVPWGQSR